MELEQLNPIVLCTREVIRNVKPKTLNFILSRAFRLMNSKVDFCVFDPEAKLLSLEDDGRTARVPCKAVSEKIYAILDDFGSPEVLSENLGEKVQTQYVLTILFASEY